MKMRYLLPMLLLAGCSAGSGMQAQVDAMNRAQEAKYSPFRTVYKEGSGGAYSIEMGAWAGAIGTTAANAAVQQRILDTFRDQCGLEQSSLREVRVVRHAPPTEWYEVWVFNNPASRRHDKASGMSVVMKYDPATNYSNVSFYGDCKI